MSHITQLAITKQIESILQHLDTFLPLANVHMVDYFTKNAYNKFIPDEIKTEVKNIGHKKAIQAIHKMEMDNLPSLNKYIKSCQDLMLRNTSICLSFSQFKEELCKLGCSDISHLKLDVFMNPKKSHEVEILSGIASAIKEIANTSHVIDIGDGKGYLSSMLALHYKIPVLGVDASEINTNSAVERANKLSKVWNGVVTNIKSRETTINLYKQITRFVDENVDFRELILNIFLKDSERISLVGLHTCGSLASTSLKIFKQNIHVKSICNIGCCYHLLLEEFEDQPKNISFNKSNIGFPMSQFLRNKKFVIGRAARMVAAQSIDRILNKKESTSISMFHRALFEILLEKYYQNQLKETQVGRFRKPSPTFSDYVIKASKRINIKVPINEEEIEKLYLEYEYRIDEMDFFFLVRCMLSQVVESLILLDRLLFLYESGLTNSYLVQCFDPVISPRCYGIISIK